MLLKNDSDFQVNRWQFVGEPQRWAFFTAKPAKNAKKTFKLCALCGSNWLFSGDALLSDSLLVLEQL